LISKINTQWFVFYEQNTCGSPFMEHGTERWVGNVKSPLVHWSAAIFRTEFWKFLDGGSTVQYWHGDRRTQLL